MTQPDAGVAIGASFQANRGHWHFEGGFGVAPESGRLEFGDGREVDLIEPGGLEGSLFVAADGTDCRVRDRAGPLP